LPAEQSEQAEEETAEAYFPWGHTTQEATEEEPVFGLKSPRSAEGEKKEN